MTVLQFPESPEDLSAAFNNALALGILCDDEKSATFWARFELLASIVKDDMTVADLFQNGNTQAFLHVPRSASAKETLR